MLPPACSVNAPLSAQVMALLMTTSLLLPVAVRLTPLPDTEPVLVPVTPTVRLPPVFVIETEPVLLFTMPVTVSPLAFASFKVKLPPAVKPKLPPRLEMALANPKVTVPGDLPLIEALLKAS